MDLNQLHFAHPLWLLGGLIIPLVWIIFFLFQRKPHTHHQLEKFIDSHLLPYLLVNNTNTKNSLWKTLLLWSIVWSCLTLALAGPRWNLREMETFSQDQSLVILLDLSESMNATDIKPSRLVRAKQKIEDLLNLSKGVKIGLIAFAADPHMITPITDDKETIRHLLPSLDTNLIYVQGSRLSSALDMASTMLEAEPGNNKALLVISDGGFEDSGAIITAKKLAEKGFVIHAMGVGTTDGTLLYDKKNVAQKNKAPPIRSRLEKERLNEISKAGNGRYLEAHYSDHEEATILKELEKRADAQKNISKKFQFWDERFYLMILPILPIILWWFRRGYVIAVIFFIFSTSVKLEAVSTEEYFKNSEELGEQAFDNGDFETAINTFQDPYRKGVANFRANNFVEAEKMFRLSSREDVACNAAYNVGNCLVQQNKLKKAITAYEKVLEKWPDHTKAKENLELVKKMLEEQKQNNSNSENSDQQDDQDENENNSEKQDKGKKQDSKGSNNKEQSKQNQQQQDNEDSDEQNDEQQGKDEKKDSQKNSDNEDSEGQQDEQQEMNEKEDSQNKNNKDSNKPQNEQKEMEVTEAAQKEEKDREAKALRSQEDQDADLWLNRINNDPKNFLKNKFYLESKRNGTKEGIDPW